MKLECDVIRDLLPLYAEKLASPASSALVEQHLAACPACRAELERMEKPVPVQPEPQPDAPLKNIRSSLNRRRLRTMLCSFAAALALAAVCSSSSSSLGVTRVAMSRVSACRCPPESSPTGCFMRSSSPMSSKASFSRKSALSLREMREKMALGAVPARR